VLIRTRTGNGWISPGGVEFGAEGFVVPAGRRTRSTLAAFDCPPITAPERKPHAQEVLV
jgi:hypothetical protein